MKHVVSFLSSASPVKVFRREGKQMAFHFKYENEFYLLKVVERKLMVNMSQSHGVFARPPKTEK